MGAASNRELLILILFLGLPPRSNKNKNKSKDKIKGSRLEAAPTKLPQPLSHRSCFENGSRFTTDNVMPLKLGLLPG